MKIYIYEELKYGNTTGFVVAAFKATPDVLADIKKWCWLTYGEPGFNRLTQQYRWIDEVHWGEVKFIHKEDLTLFKLRWS